MKILLLSSPSGRGPNCHCIIQRITAIATAVVISTAQRRGLGDNISSSSSSGSSSNISSSSRDNVGSSSSSNSSSIMVIKLVTDINYKLHRITIALLDNLLHNFLAFSYYSLLWPQYLRGHREVI